MLQRLLCLAEGLQVIWTGQVISAGTTPSGPAHSMCSGWHLWG